MIVNEEIIKSFFKTLKHLMLDFSCYTVYKFFNGYQISVDILKINNYNIYED